MYQSCYFTHNVPPWRKCILSKQEEEIFKVPFTGYYALSAIDRVYDVTSDGSERREVSQMDSIPPQVYLTSGRWYQVDLSEYNLSGCLTLRVG